jgi:hypothetical protein
MHHLAPTKDPTMQHHYDSTLLRKGTPHTSTPDRTRPASAPRGPHAMPLYADHPCSACGSGGPHTLSPGAGPWHAQLTCHCGQHVRWLSKYQTKQYHLAQQRPARRLPDTVMGRAFQAAMQRQGVRS